MGFSQRFVSVVAALHHNTTCSFIVNGFHSRQQVVSCGIRQGCPLAPLLFILALDNVYRVLQESTDIRGVLIKSGDKSTEIKVSGYADDTAFYLRDHSLIKYVLSILDELAGVSGLTTNMSKSMVLRLHSRDYIYRWTHEVLR